MFISDCIQTTPNGKPLLLVGSLLSIPPELGGTTKINMYSRIVSAGYHIIDHGYLAYVHISPNHFRYCFPAIIPDDPKFNNKLKINELMRKSKFDRYINSVISLENDIRKSSNDDMNLIIHDLRQLSSAIYNAAQEALIFFTHHKYDNVVTDLIGNIVAAQQMLKIRTDMIDYSGGGGQRIDVDYVPVFRRVDKVVRSFRPAANRSRLKIELSGTSYSASHGPNILEIVPYIIIDNAVKYAPHNDSIDVQVWDSGSWVNFSISSLGPEILPEEKELIFERGYRGEATRARSDAGSGLGLFICKNIVDEFKGTIEVHIGDSEIKTQKGPCRQITFTVRLPISYDRRD